MKLNYVREQRVRLKSPFRFDWETALKYLVDAKRYCVRWSWFEGNQKLKNLFKVKWDGEKFIRKNGKEWKPSREDTSAVDWLITT